MARLLAADIIIFSEHGFENISVAYFCGYKIHIINFTEFVEAHICHYCAYNCVLLEYTSALEVSCNNSDYVVAVNKLALVINSKTSVSVTVKSKACIEIVILYKSLESLNMC